MLGERFVGIFKKNKNQSKCRSIDLISENLKMQQKILENIELTAERCTHISEKQSERLLKNKMTSNIFLAISHCYSEESLVQRKACILQSVFKKVCKDDAQGMLLCVRNYQKVPKSQVPQNACEDEVMRFIGCSEKLAIIPQTVQDFI